MIEASRDAEQLGEMREVLLIERAVLTGDIVGDFDIGAGGKRGQEIELLEDEADFRLSHLRAFCVIEGGEVYAADFDFSGRCEGESAEQVEER